MKGGSVLRVDLPLVTHALFYLFPMLTAPRAEFVQHASQAPTVIGRFVKNAHRYGVKHLARDEAVQFQMFQFIGQYFRGDAQDLILYFIESLGGVHQVEDDGELPLAVQDIQGIQYILKRTGTFYFGGDRVLNRSCHS